ncbi:MAG: PilZ domain-containing protein, partial [Phycisphaerales bacterium]|nr:PilZ domain-containing protein [Phycisphaerales bacterium]
MPKRSKAADPGRPNSLGLREKELNQIRDALDQARKGENAGRVFARWHYNEGSVPVKIIHHVGNEMDVRMACRNLSKGGIGLLHRSYLHLGTRCDVTLEHPTLGEIVQAGAVIRCIHLTGMVHEIGIKFDQEINIRDIMRPDPMQEMLAVESIEPSTLIGTILLVEDSEMDTRLVRHFLRDTQLRIKHVGTIKEAQIAAKSGVGLILCDIH